MLNKHCLVSHSFSWYIPNGFMKNGITDVCKICVNCQQSSSHLKLFTLPPLLALPTNMRYVYSDKWNEQISKNLFWFFCDLKTNNPGRKTVFGRIEFAGAVVLSHPDISNCGIERPLSFQFPIKIEPTFRLKFWF